ncbi:MAG: hypothetical protein QN193_08490 [Armatimonadota bacterium]|nr:hypothetical protein [Armatimonadota bacterium]MDR7445150.1 hypothetical protein [Armatimonadota bacterium]MDR7570633.1 hypothetical protein [Armatimonadota bacterium]MDR7613993.1 hypothetical protein [Armatimonadota bacterium]
MISDPVGQEGGRLVDLLNEGLEAPPLYQDLATAYTDLEGLMAFLRRRSFSGVIAVRWPQRAYHLLLFRGRVRYARTPSGALAEPETAVALLVREGEQPEGVVSVHPLPEELFPEAWIEPPEPQPVPSEPASEVLPGGGREAPGTEGVEVWVGVLEGLFQRYRKLAGPGPARQLEAEIQAVLSGTGGSFVGGRLQGSVEIPFLRAAVARCAEVIREVAGRAFLARAVQGLLREMGVTDPDLSRRITGS